MSKALMVLTLVAVTHIAGCAGPASLHPISSPEAADPVPESWLGRWKIIELLGVPPENSGTDHLSISRGEGNGVTISMEDARGSAASVGVLKQFGDWYVLSLSSESTEQRFWTLLRVEIDENDSRLTVRAMLNETIKEYVEAAQIAGRVSVGTFRDDEVLVTLEAMPSELQAFIAQHGAALFEEPFAIVERESAAGGTKRIERQQLGALAALVAVIVGIAAFRIAHRNRRESDVLLKQNSSSA